jgi:hypothetical protein
VVPEGPNRSANGSRVVVIAWFIAAAVFIAVIYINVLRNEASQRVQNNRVGSEAVERYVSELSNTAQALASQQKSSGLSDVFEMLGNRRPFDSAVIAATRPKIDEMVQVIDDCSTKLQRARDGVATYPSQGTSVELSAKKMGVVFDIKRRYLAEVGLFLDFLIEKAPLYSMTTAGPRFQNVADAKSYNAFMDRLIKQEQELAVAAQPVKF